MLDILMMGIMSPVQRSELTVCTVAFPDYCKYDLNANKEVKKVQIITAAPILIYDLLYDKAKCNSLLEFSNNVNVVNSARKVMTESLY